MHGRGRVVAALVAVVTTGCFNPGGAGEATAATTGAGPTSTTSAATSGDPSSEPPGPTDSSSPGGTTASSQPSDPTTGSATASTEPDTGVGPDASTSAGPSSDPDTTDPTNTTTDPPVNGPVSFTVDAALFSGAFGVAAVNFDGDELEELFVTSIMVTSVGVVYDGDVANLKTFGGGAARTLVPIQGAMQTYGGMLIPPLADPSTLQPYYDDDGTPMLGPNVLIPNACKQPLAIAAANLTADTASDVAFVCADTGGVFVAAGSNNGGFDAPGMAVVGVMGKDVAIAEVNGDDKKDLLVLTDAQLDIYLGQGGLTFGAAAQSIGLTMPTALVTGDVNLDGSTDVVVTKVSGVCDVFIGGNGDFPGPLEQVCGAVPQDLVIADLNADLYPEIVIADAAGASVLYNKGDSTFTMPMSIASVVSAARVASGDFSGDGKPDVAVTGSGKLTLLVQN